MNLLEGLATTRTIRRYAPETIPEEVLSQMLWHATRAPSGSNRQPVRYLVLRDGPQALMARHLLRDAAREAWGQKARTDGYREASGTAPDSPKARMAATMQHYVDHMHEAPVIVLVCLQRYRDAHPYEGASVYPAVQNLLLAARGLGYGGAVNLWQLLVEQELREVLHIPEGVALSACVTLGRPAGAHGSVRRRPLHDVVFDDEWGHQASWAGDPAGTRYTHWKAPGAEPA
ncbi:MAG: nitroreductase family protein [Actinomycetota bacterium]|nr:nitroreductase family protein [Actinomycetota bacterium]